MDGEEDLYDEFGNYMGPDAGDEDLVSARGEQPESAKSDRQPRACAAPSERSARDLVPLPPTPGS